jgi:hypothetical protein
MRVLRSSGSARESLADFIATVGTWTCKGLAAEPLYACASKEAASRREACCRCRGVRGFPSNSFEDRPLTRISHQREAGASEGRGFSPAAGAAPPPIPSCGPHSPPANGLRGPPDTGLTMWTL